MKHDKALSAFVGKFLLALPLLLLATGAGATTFKVYYQFQGGNDGVGPSNVVADSAGNLYGVTSGGGTYNAGTIFKLTQSGGIWTNTVLYNFCSRVNCPDGWAPDSTLTIDKEGNLYGITLWGGDQSCQYGCGVAFRLSPAKGVWKFKVLHRFSHTDGYYPQAPLTLDSAGNLFGTTSDADGYVGHFGTVFKLTGAHGKWTKTVLHSFTDNDDGANPFSGVIFDPAGNLYGTTANGGVYHDGVVYQLSPSGQGWTEKTLHSFSNDRIDGQNPYSGVTLDAAGNLYGATFVGGDFSGRYCGGGCGIVYQLTPSGGTWTENILYKFTGGADGSYPGAELVLDSSGNLYGTATSGGRPACDDGYGCGVVFKLIPANGAWTEAVLHRFTGKNDGWAPGRSLFFDQKGRLYGYDAYGVPYNAGNLFVLKP